jgi:hypothetical protein
MHIGKQHQLMFAVHDDHQSGCCMSQKVTLLLLERLQDSSKSQTTSLQTTFICICSAAVIDHRHDNVQCIYAKTVTSM